MELKKINLLVTTLSPIMISSFVVSCKTKKVQLSEAVAIKNLGYVTDLTERGVLKKLLELNPNIDVSDGELSVVVRPHKASFSIHPAFKNRGKYSGSLEVNFESYIMPLYDQDVSDDLIIHLTQDQPNFTVRFAITKDYPVDKEFAC